MTAYNYATNPVFVLSTDAVKWGIQELRKQKIHASFFLYLHLRKTAMATHVFEDFEMSMAEIAHQLNVPGGPPNKPYFRPMWQDNTTDGAAYWLNANLAGSYGRSSLRTAAEWMKGGGAGLYSLPQDHLGRARRNFLYDEPVSALAFGAFVFRNYGFDLYCEEGHPEDIIAALRDYFEFPEGEMPASLPDHFESLFDASIPSVPFDWFVRPSEERQHG